MEQIISGKKISQLTNVITLPDREEIINNSYLLLTSEIDRKNYKIGVNDLVANVTGITPDLSDYATKEYVAEQIAGITSVDPSIVERITTLETNVTAYEISNTEEHNSLFASITGIYGDLENYATKQFVDDEIEAKASINVERAILNHIVDVPINEVTNKAISSNWAYDTEKHLESHHIDIIQLQDIKANKLDVYTKDELNVNIPHEETGTRKLDTYDNINFYYSDIPIILHTNDTITSPEYIASIVGPNIDIRQYQIPVPFTATNNMNVYAFGSTNETVEYNINCQVQKIQDAVEYLYEHGGTTGIEPSELVLSENYHTATGTNLDLLLSPGDKYEEAFGKLEKAIIDDEDITSHALIDLNSKINIQSNWNEDNPSSLAYIQNKPNIPETQVQSDWAEEDTTSPAYIQNKPTVHLFNLVDGEDEISIKSNKSNCFLEGTNSIVLGQGDISVGNGNFLFSQQPYFTIHVSGSGTNYTIWRDENNGDPTTQYGIFPYLSSILVNTYIFNTNYEKICKILQASVNQDNNNKIDIVTDEPIANEGETVDNISLYICSNIVNSNHSILFGVHQNFIGFNKTKNLGRNVVCGNRNTILDAYDTFISGTMNRCNSHVSNIYGYNNNILGGDPNNCYENYIFGTCNMMGDKTFARNWLQLWANVIVGTENQIIPTDSHSLETTHAMGWSHIFGVCNTHYHTGNRQNVTIVGGYNNVSFVNGHVSGHDNNIMLTHQSVYGNIFGYGLSLTEENYNSRFGWVVSVYGQGNEDNLDPNTVFVLGSGPYLGNTYFNRHNTLKINYVDETNEWVDYFNDTIIYKDLTKVHGATIINSTQNNVQNDASIVLDDIIYYYNSTPIALEKGQIIKAEEIFNVPNHNPKYKSDSFVIINAADNSILYTVNDHKIYYEAHEPLSVFIGMTVAENIVTVTPEEVTANIGKSVIINNTDKYDLDMDNDIDEDDVAYAENPPAFDGLSISINYTIHDTVESLQSEISNIKEHLTNLESLVNNLINSGQ